MLAVGNDSSAVLLAYSLRGWVVVVIRSDISIRFNLSNFRNSSSTRFIMITSGPLRLLSKAPSLNTRWCGGCFLTSTWIKQSLWPVVRFILFVICFRTVKPGSQMTVKTMFTLAVYFQAMKPYLLSSWYIVKENECCPSLLDLKSNLNILIQLAV